MNAFCEHHKNSIKFGYRCLDRILLNGLIQPFQQPERVIGFFNAYREGLRVTRKLLGDIAQQFQNWVKNRCQKWGVPILDAPDERRDDFVAPYFKHAKNDAVVVILKAREPARIIGSLSACVPKASILNNVPMHSSDALIHRSSRSWQIP